MEVEYTEGIPQEELKVYRSYMNTKIDIFQNNDYVFRTGKRTKSFYESFEHRQMQNNSAKILSSASDILVYSLAKGIDSVELTQNKLKQTFSNNIEDNKNPSFKAEEKYSEFKKNVMRKKLESNEEYKQLCEFINNIRFHEIMISNNQFVRFILYHKYITYHPRYEEINEKYSKYLCTFRIQNQNLNQNDENEDMEEDN